MANSVYIEGVAGFNLEPASGTSSSSNVSSDNASSFPDPNDTDQALYFTKTVSDKLTKAELEELLEDHNLRGTGTKPILMATLQMFYLGWQGGDVGKVTKYFKMAKEDLKLECTAANLETNGTNAEMRRRLVLAAKANDSNIMNIDCPPPIRGPAQPCVQTATLDTVQTPTQGTMQDVNQAAAQTSARGCVQPSTLDAVQAIIQPGAQTPLQPPVPTLAATLETVHVIGDKHNAGYQIETRTSGVSNKASESAQVQEPREVNMLQSVPCATCASRITPKATLPLSVCYALDMLTAMVKHEQSQLNHTGDKILISLSVEKELKLILRGLKAERDLTELTCRLDEI